MPGNAGFRWLFRLGLAKCLYPVLAGRTQPNEVERVDRCQAFAPCVGHVTLCNLRSPGEAAALTALHVGVLCRGSNVAVLWVVSPGDLQSNSTKMKPFAAEHMLQTAADVTSLQVAVLLSGIGMLEGYVCHTYTQPCSKGYRPCQKS